MKKKTKINLALIVLGFALLLIGITLFVLYQNDNNSSSHSNATLSFIHNKIVLDYLLIIIGAILLSIPVFNKMIISGKNLSEIKLQKSKLSKTDNSMIEPTKAIENEEIT